MQYKINLDKTNDQKMKVFSVKVTIQDDFVKPLNLSKFTFSI